MMSLPAAFAPWLTLILAGYMLCAQWIKRAYVKRFGAWL